MNQRLCGIPHPRNVSPKAIYLTAEKQVLNTGDDLFCTESAGHVGPHKTSEESAIKGLVWDHSWVDARKWCPYCKGAGTVPDPQVEGAAFRKRRERPQPFGDPAGPAWQRGETYPTEPGVRLSEMACCGFRFDAEHTNPDGSLTCPLCEPPAATEREPVPVETVQGDLAQAYMVHVSDGEGPLFYVRVRPEPTIWLRPGATAADVATAYLAAERGPVAQPPEEGK